MRKYIFFTAALFYSLLALSQKQESFYDDGQLKFSGETKTYKQKGMYTTMVEQVKTGEWSYYYQNGTLAKKEFYKAKDGIAERRGVWEYYAEDGRLLKRISYEKSNAIEFLDTGLFSWEGDTVEVAGEGKDTLFFYESIAGIKSSGSYINGVIKVSAKKFGNTPDLDELQGGKPNIITDYYSNPEALRKFDSLIPPPENFTLNGANLIKNHDFSAPPPGAKPGFYTGEAAADWGIAAGTPDYCLQTQLQDKNPVMGFRVYALNDKDIEYMQTQLTEPLVEGKNYCLRFQLLLHDKTGLAVRQIGARFENTPKFFSGRRTKIPPAHVYNYKDMIYGSMEKWMGWCGEYTAKGDEQVLIIGSFLPLGSQQVYMISSTMAEEAYYYIDNVYLYEITENTPCECFSKDRKVEEVVPADTLQEGASFILQNILFETDKAILKSVSFTELDKLYDILQQYPSMEIEISGHTDNTGSDERNTELSQQRADAVKAYLVKKGIAKERMVAVGYGSEEPIDDNETAQGRSRNRRVEFKIEKR